MITALKLLVAAGLGAFYLEIAFLTEHPRADAEYDAHYLHRSADCWFSQAVRAADQVPPASLQVGQIGYPEACRYLRLGWHQVEDWGVWADSDRATLRLPRRPGTRAVELTLRAAPAPGSVIHVQFMLNGRTTHTDITPGATQTVTLPLPPEGERYDPDVHLSFDGYAVLPKPPYRFGSRAATRHVSIGLIAIHYLAQ